MERSRVGRFVGRVYSCYVASMKSRSLSSKEPTLRTVLSSVVQIGKAVGMIGVKVDHLEQKVDQLGQKVDQLDQKVDTLEQKMDRLEVRVDRLEHETQSVRDAVEFVKDNAVTRDEFTSEVRRVEHAIIDHVDHFVKLHKKQEVELAAVAHGLIRHEQTFHRSQTAA